MAFWKIRTGATTRWATGPVDRGPRWLVPADVSLDTLLAGPSEAFGRLARRGSGDPVPADAQLVAPVDGQEVWAAGVTYTQSKIAREEESDTPAHYEHVYGANRPELFLKSVPGRSQGPGEPVAIRADSGWDVPEPELGLVVNSTGRIVAYVVGNDMSSRSIEGENPLYLPQAKVYTASCAVGPCIVPVEDAPPLQQMRIRLRITRDGQDVFDDSVPVANLRRTPDELCDWLMVAQEFPVGVVLLTGTGLVPDSSFTLRPRDRITIAITGLGELHNTVTVVGRTALSEPTSTEEIA